MPVPVLFCPLCPTLRVVYRSLCSFASLVPVVPCVSCSPPLVRAPRLSRPPCRCGPALLPESLSPPLCLFLSLPSPTLTPRLNLWGHPLRVTSCRGLLPCLTGYIESYSTSGKITGPNPTVPFARMPPRISTGAVRVCGTNSVMCRPVCGAPCRTKSPLGCPAAARCCCHLGFYGRYFSLKGPQSPRHATMWSMLSLLLLLPRFIEGHTFTISCLCFLS